MTEITKLTKMETLFSANKIIEFQSNKKTFDMWKKLVIEKINIENKKSENAKFVWSLKDLNKYLKEWKWWDIDKEKDKKEEEEKEKEKEKEEKEKEKKEEKEKEKKEEKEKEKKEEKEKEEEKEEKEKEKKTEENWLYKKKLFDENYLNEFERYIENLNNDIETTLKESINDTCIVTYENFINRNANISDDYVNDISFLKYFYSSIHLIKENRVLIPKGHYLYELIYPQTNNFFPVVNKFHYYFVKLFINNEWVLVFVDLCLPVDKDNRFLVCFSSNKKEIWPLIIQKALYTCFQEWNFLHSHLYIIELLTGLKFIKNNYEDKKIEEYDKNNYIQCVLLSDHNKKEMSTYNEKCYIERNEVTAKLNKKELRVKKKNKKKLKQSFFFLICSYEKEYLGIKCDRVQPKNSILFLDSIFYKEKNKILKGYKYVSGEGKIKIRNKVLVPIVQGITGATEEFSEKRKNNKKGENKNKDEQNEQNEKIRHTTLRTFLINENTTKVLELLKEMINSEYNKKKKKKCDSNVDKKKKKEIMSTWLNESDLEKISENIYITYSFEYVIKKCFLKKEKVISYIPVNKFTSISVRNYLKNENNTTHEKNRKGQKTTNAIIDPASTFPYLILICVIVIKNKQIESKYISENENLTKLSNGHGMLDQMNNFENNNKFKREDAIIENEGENNEMNKMDMYTKDKTLDLYLSFFPCSNKMKKPKRRKSINRRNKKDLKNVFYDYEQIERKMHSLKCKKRKKKKKILFPEDIYKCECFFKKMYEMDSHSEYSPIFCMNNFMYDLLNNKHKAYIFQNKIKKKRICIEKKNKEHFFFLYLKNCFFTNFIIEWINEKKKKGNISISCDFMTLTEFFEKKNKTYICSLRKSVSLKMETFNKVLFRFRIDFSLEKNQSPFFYLIYRINKLHLLPFLYMYLGLIEKEKEAWEKKETLKKKKTVEDSLCKDKCLISLEKLHKFYLQNMFLKVSLPNHKKNASYIILIIMNNIEKKNKRFYFSDDKTAKIEEEEEEEEEDTNKEKENSLQFEIMAAIPNNRNKDNSETNSKKKKGPIQINELVSYCKSYAFEFKEAIKEMNNNKFYFINKKRKEKLDCKNTKEVPTDVYKENQKGETFEYLVIIKKIHIHSKKELTRGSIYVHLNYPHIFDHVKVKIVNVMKTKMNGKNIEDLSFFQKRRKESVILKKKRKSSIFFKNIKLLTNENYFIHIVAAKILSSKKTNMKKESIINKDHYIDDEFNKNCLPFLNVYLNFTEEVTLIADTRNEELQKEIKKYIELNKINIEEKENNLNNKKWNNVFALKNELLLHLKTDYRSIFLKLANEKYKKCSEENEENKKNMDKNTVNTTFIDKTKIETDSKKSESTELLLSKEQFCNSNLLKRLKFDKESLEFIFTKYFDKNKKRTIDVNRFIDVFRNIRNEDLYTHIPKFEKFEKQPLNFNAGNKFDVERREKEKDYKRKKNYVSTTAIDPNMTTNSNSVSLNIESLLSSDGLFSYSSETQKMINDIHTNINYRNKIDITKMKMDAELQISENAIPLLQNVKSISKIIKKNLYYVKKINSKMSSIEKDATKRNRSYLFNQVHVVAGNTFFVKNSDYENKNGSEDTVSNNIKNSNSRSIRKASDKNKSSMQNSISERHAKIEITSFEKQKNCLYRVMKIEPEISSVHDLASAIKKLDVLLESKELKNAKSNFIKIVKERKAFIENMKNQIKNKKWKNLKSEECRKLFKKGLELNLDIYDYNLLENMHNQCKVLDILDEIKCMFKNNTMKKKKNEINESIHVTNMLTNKENFMKSFQKYLYLIKTSENVQLNDTYQKIVDDSQLIFNKILRESKYEKEHEK